MANDKFIFYCWLTAFAVAAATTTFNMRCIGIEVNTLLRAASVTGLALSGSVRGVVFIHHKLSFSRSLVWHSAAIVAQCCNITNEVAESGQSMKVANSVPFMWQQQLHAK